MEERHKGRLQLVSYKDVSLTRKQCMTYLLHAGHNTVLQSYTTVWTQNNAYH